MSLGLFAAIMFLWVLPSVLTMAGLTLTDKDLNIRKEGFAIVFFSIFYPLGLSILIHEFFHLPNEIKEKTIIFDIPEEVIEEARTDNKSWQATFVTDLEKVKNNVS